ncbi:MAG TPA: hypothetical protein VFX72_10155 [Usitatibacteraceae bacterium]|nr:hypothetical protein [Usitatibacteraceae bacterium]
MRCTRLLSLACAALAALLATAPGIGAQNPPPAPDTGSYLYRFVIVQAAPGKLLDLIELYRSRMPVVAAGGDELPFIVRHSQGDHWDLCIIYPSGSFTEYYSRERVAKRAAAADASGVANAEFARRFYSMVSWHEDLYATGPPLEVFKAHIRGAGLAHFEMLLALAGKRDELIKERQMENVFNRERGRGGTLIFVHDQGAAWDVITLGVYRDWRHYAESDAIPAEVSLAAAKKAGFASPDAIGPYMRTLISTHRDTLGPIQAMGLAAR